MQTNQAATNQSWMQFWNGKGVRPTSGVFTGWASYNSKESPVAAPVNQPPGFRTPAPTNYIPRALATPGFRTPQTSNYKQPNQNWMGATPGWAVGFPLPDLLKNALSPFGQGKGQVPYGPPAPSAQANAAALPVTPIGVPRRKGDNPGLDQLLHSDQFRLWYNYVDPQTGAKNSDYWDSLNNADKADLISNINQTTQPGFPNNQDRLAAMATRAAEDQAQAVPSLATDASNNPYGGYGSSYYPYPYYPWPTSSYAQNWLTNLTNWNIT
jgi:hypothetical protein